MTDSPDFLRLFKSLEDGKPAICRRADDARVGVLQWACIGLQLPMDITATLDDVVVIKSHRHTGRRTH